MVYSAAIINSEIFERLRSSKYTPSVSHSLDSSLREGAGMGRVPFNRVLAKIPGYGRFSSPLRNSEIFTFHHSSRDTPSVSFADSSLREGAGEGLCHSSYRPETMTLRAIFIAPTERAIHRAARKAEGFGRFSSSEALGMFYIPPFNRGGGRLGWFFCGKYGK